MPCLLAVDEPLEPGGRVRLGRGAVEDEAVPDPVVDQAAADHRASVQQLCKKERGRLRVRRLIEKRGGSLPS